MNCGTAQSDTASARLALSEDNKSKYKDLFLPRYAKGKRCSCNSKLIRMLAEDKLPCPRASQTLQREMRDAKSQVLSSSTRLCN